MAKDTFPHPPNHSVIASVVEDREIPSLLTRLRPHLPYCLPLYRRLQFHLVHPNPPHGHALLVLADPSDVDKASSTATPPWLAAHIDLTCSGQTQVWVYGSWERDSDSLSLPEDDSLHPQAQPTSTNNPTHTIPPLPTRKTLFSALLHYISSALVPTLPTNPPTQWLKLEREGKYLSKPYSRSKVLFGAFSSSLWDCLPHSTLGFVSRVDRWYSKFVFTPSATAAPAPATPPNADFHFAPMQQEHLQTVLDRTPIPRTLQTLSMLPAVGLFHKSHPEPIGWGFLGKDASLSSLHIEPEFRGQGLAVCISEKLFEIQRERGGMFGDTWGDGGDELQLEGFAHSDVSESNKGSLRVMEKLGGKALSRVCWVEVDLAMMFEGGRNGDGVYKG